MTRTWRSMKARFKAARISASIGRLKSRPVTSAPVCSAKGAIVNDVTDFLSLDFCKRYRVGLLGAIVVTLCLNIGSRPYDVSYRRPAPNNKGAAHCGQPL